MAVHRLSLEFPETLNTCLIRIQDSSSYAESMGVKCPRLQISVPGFSNSVYIEDIEIGFSLNLTACDLKIQKQNCGKEFNDLPDGVYVIEYSVSPNDTVYVSYNILRQSKALNKVKSLYCNLDLDNCLSNATRSKELQNLRTIQDYLSASKAYVEYCKDSKRGLEMFKKAQSMLDKFQCKGCHK